MVLTPPRVIPDDVQHYINQGGMELVTFNATGPGTRPACKVGKYTFRSFPLPGKGPEQRFSMFAYSVGAAARRHAGGVCAQSRGHGSDRQLLVQALPEEIPHARFEADDKLMEKLVTSVDPTGQIAPGADLVDALRQDQHASCARKNNQQLADLRFKTEEKILWNGPFIHWGKEEADFADVRNWML